MDMWQEQQLKAAAQKEYEKAQAQYASSNQAQVADFGIGGCTEGIASRRRYSLREEAEQRVGHHRQEADRADRAVAFFREHPAFDEFIQLIRSGVISI